MSYIDLIKANKDKNPAAYQAAYESLIVSAIRQRYSINQELSLHRQKYDKPAEYQEYYVYVEQCKANVKDSLK